MTLEKRRERMYIRIFKVANLNSREKGKQIGHIRNYKIFTGIIVQKSFLLAKKEWFQPFGEKRLSKNGAKIYNLV